MSALSNYTSLTLWDIDCEFQKSYDAYEQWLSKNRRKRTRWECFASKNHDDELGKALTLGRSVQNIIECGQDTFGSRFERGDSICNTILESQLLRAQQEISVPLLDAALSRVPIPIPTSDIITAAKAIRRTCLSALRDQYTRFKSTTSIPFLPPPRFSVQFCPFASQLQKDRSTNFQTRKVRPHDRHDERETCPSCHAQISVSLHSGLPEYRRLLFMFHTPPPSTTEKHSNTQASFACTGCYKNFETSYGFLDHVFQKERGSERSCLRKWSSAWNLNEVYLESDPDVVEKCLKNCLRRELTRLRKAKEWDF
ncbi:hypothetical protein K469DRAFT_394972 [Zopfia rhizophila CBS 207.26]|uniref:C2H2-type domain-containing protein n=1 Tax=Zopfia rhizophila CBS 207.26 TaxID=1314779 RepID=A0A6A6EHH1_9PEZI|nr:hypothetical protein K469DRAFT_394972 [Zopfia rhizophila CBS 207.26]